MARVVEWLRKSQQKLALLTNGVQWRPPSRVRTSAEPARGPVTTDAKIAQPSRGELKLTSQTCGAFGATVAVTDQVRPASRVE